LFSLLILTAKIKISITINAFGDLDAAATKIDSNFLRLFYSLVKKTAALLKFTSDKQ